MQPFTHDSPPTLTPSLSIVWAPKFGHCQPNPILFLPRNHAFIIKTSASYLEKSLSTSKLLISAFEIHWHFVTFSCPPFCLIFSKPTMTVSFGKYRPSIIFSLTTSEKLFLDREITLTTNEIVDLAWVIVCVSSAGCTLCTPWNRQKPRTAATVDQDSLLVKRRNDNHSPGPVIRESVPSSHQRSELSNTILCTFSGWDQSIGEGIPITDSLGEEATFINICIGNGSLKCHRVLIPTTPSFGDKIICWYTGFTFKIFI